MHAVLCPKPDENTTDHISFYVREILISERFYIEILHVDMDRRKAQTIMNLCIKRAFHLKKKKPESSSTYDYTIVRHAIAQICEENGYVFTYKPLKPSKKDMWLLHNETSSEGIV